jgi:K+-sensing histidine kinase KdpD
MERRRAEEELIALNAIATTISQELDLERMLNAILQKLLEVIGAQVGAIRLVDRGSRDLSLAAHCLPPRESAQAVRFCELEEQSAGEAYSSEEPIVRTLGPAARGVSGGQGAPQAIIGVPVRSRDTVIGVLSVLVHAPRRSDEPKVALLTSIGHQIGVAVENAWLVEEVSKAEIWRELNRLRSELIANVSHEMRTPLGLIKAACTSLLSTEVDFDPAIVREFLQGIDEETDRLETIVGSLLDLSQIESGRMHLDIEPVDVAQLVPEVIVGLSSQSTAHEILYDFDQPLLASVDRGRIEQVLRNLLVNAVKYSPDGGAIRVRGAVDEGQVVVAVCDQGIGIPEEDRERVFERFYRVENEATQTQRGVGLGLAVCKHIVEAHGGRVWVESELGVGSAFYVALPMALQGELSSAPAVAAGAPG